MQLHFSCPDEVVNELDKHVDGVRYRNRTHLMFTIFMDWLSNKEKIRSERMRKTCEPDMVPELEQVFQKHEKWDGKSPHPYGCDEKD